MPAAPMSRYVPGSACLRGINARTDEASELRRPHGCAEGTGRLSVNRRRIRLVGGPELVAVDDVDVHVDQGATMLGFFVAGGDGVASDEGGGPCRNHWLSPASMGSVSSSVSEP